MKLLLDVRTEEEYEQECVANSLNIPHNELKDRLDELDKEKEIFVYCRSGQRAMFAARVLTSLGYNAKNIGNLEAAKVYNLLMEETTYKTNI